MDQVWEAMTPDERQAKRLDDYVAMPGFEFASPEAEALYREALRLCPAEARYHHHLGLLLGRRGDDESAVRHLFLGVALEPTLTDLFERTGAVLFRLWRRDGDRRLLDDALLLLRRAAAQDPAGVLSRMWRLTDDRRLVERATCVDARARIAFLRSLRARGLWIALRKEAAEPFPAADRSTSNAERLLLLGEAELRSGHEETALLTLKAYLDGAPNRFDALRRVQSAFASARRWDVATLFWGAWREERHPTQALIYELEALLRSGRAGRAAARLKPLEPLKTPELLSLAWRVDEALGNKERAYRHLRLSLIHI